MSFQTRRLAAYAVALCSLHLVPSVGRTQELAGADATRWSVGGVALGGPGALVGAEASIDVHWAAQFQLALEASALVNLRRDSEFAPCPLPPAPCTAPRRPPYVDHLWTLALRGEYPLGVSWRAVASTDIVSGEWRRPQETSPVAFDIGVGLALESRTGAHVFEVRGHQIHTASYPTHAARVTWRVRL